MLPLEKATYRARAVASRGFGEASTKNNQIAIECEVVDHDQYAGERITWIGTFTTNTTPRVLESLMIMGWQGDQLDELDEGCDVAKLLPDVFELACDVEVDQKGVERLRANWVNRPGAGRFAFERKLEGRDLAGFAAQMRNAVRDARGAPKPKPQAKPASNGGTSRQQQPHPNAPGGRNDDIPF